MWQIWKYVSTRSAARLRGCQKLLCDGALKLTRLAYSRSSAEDAPYSADRPQKGPTANMPRANDVHDRCTRNNCG